MNTFVIRKPGKLCLKITEALGETELVVESVFGETREDLGWYLRD